MGLWPRASEVPDRLKLFVHCSFALRFIRSLVIIIILQSIYLGGTVSLTYLTILNSVEGIWVSLEALDPTEEI